MTATWGIRALSMGAGSRLTVGACAVRAGKGRDDHYSVPGAIADRACVFEADVATLRRFLLRTDNLGAELRSDFALSLGIDLVMLLYFLLDT